MGTWICHLRVTENVLPYFPGLDEVAFAFGNLSPDSGIPNKDWTEFDPPKEVTHFLQKGEAEYAIHDLDYYREYVAGLKPEDDIQRYSFRLGYFFHLVCDIIWAKRIWEATQQHYKPLFDNDFKKAVSLVKDDWYGLDQLYVRDHPTHIFWRVIMSNPYPPSYLPFLNVQAMHHQYDHIRKFYSEQEDKWFLSIPYHYLNETTMGRVIDDSVHAIVAINEKVQALKDFDGFSSSVSLLPPALLEPYEGPLGNLPA